MTEMLTRPVEATGAGRYRNPRDFVKPEVWDREITLLMRDHPFDEVMATRLFHAAVSYLITAMEKWDEPVPLEMCCGRIVDIAVHAFILDTRNYREFCHEHFGGRFLEHIPEIAFKYDGSVERTAQIIHDNGFEVDWKLWEADYAKCGPCNPGSKCH
ncbi:glycine-rich domain-containing protein [Streptomyces lavendulae]|uniref:glycine-rich domain-containing protein n=1 Tax=Streptomyces lavendulae TaxID=1914 RepID=UPI003713161B